MADPEAGRLMLAEIVTPLLTWYQENKKKLPWRESRDPYKIWLSEIMLQQTRIEAVIPYYRRFLNELPDVETLANAPEEQILKLWEGLGYYSRARNLGKAAKQIMSQYGGVFPEEASELKKLSGIGDYTAGAIASIAFGKAEPAVDGNVLRVVMRYLASDEDISLPATQKNVAEMLRKIYPAGENAGHFTQAIMELGENVCIPNGEAKCGDCPLREGCKARQNGCIDTLPFKSPKKARKQEPKTVFLLSCRGKYAVCKRAENGLLAGMWEFPNADGTLSEEEATAWLIQKGVEPVCILPCGEAVHIFTHIEWHMCGFAAECAAMPECFRWESAETILENYAIPTAFRFMRKHLKR